MKKFLSVSLVIAIVISFAVELLAIPAFADYRSETLTGRVYDLGEKDKYEIAKARVTNDTASRFYLRGDIASVSSKNGFASYGVQTGNLDLVINEQFWAKLYDPSDSTEWHIVSDSSKTVDSTEFTQKINSGAIIVQTSKDGKTWITSDYETDFYANMDTMNHRSSGGDAINAFYRTTNVQLTNGCYYRIIVAYKLQRNVDPTQIWFVSVPKTEEKERIEIYQFYAFDTTVDQGETLNTKNAYEFGEVYRVDSQDGFANPELIKSDDPHIDWTVGKFYVSGYTDVRMENGVPVFLKVPGDRAALWFNLEQELDKCNGRTDVKINYIESGSDIYFGTPEIKDFGRGTLIVRRTDKENKKERQIYTNYLEASATVGANTRVDLFEEGDYEVALDYQLHYDMSADSAAPDMNIRNETQLPQAGDEGTEYADVVETPAKLPSYQVSSNSQPDITFTGLDDASLLQYVEDNVYTSLIQQLNSEDYFIENVEAIYYPKEYLEALAFNSQPNRYFGFTVNELNEQFQGTKYVFTLGADGQTIVVPMETVDDDIYVKAMEDVLIGTGVILICVTVSVVAAPAAPAVGMIFAASASTGTAFALESGAISFAAAAIAKGYETESFEQAMKAGIEAGGEGFKWGAIIGVAVGGAQEAIALKGATLNGLTMNEAARIQKESGYPLELIKQFKSVEEYEVYKNAGLYTKMVNGKLALVRNIDLEYVSELPTGEKVTNLVRMQKGYAPLDPATGKAYQLHHINQNPNGTLAILTEAEHQGNSSILNLFGKESEIDRKAFDAIRKEFWQKFAAGLL